MNPELVQEILNVIVNNLGIYLLIIIIGWKIISLLKLRNKLLESEIDNNSDRLGSLSEESRQFHEFIKFIITETSIVKFKKYIMTNDLSKSTRNGIQVLINEIATDVYESLQNKEYLFDKSNLLTEKYYMQYITDLTIVTVEKLLDDSI